MFLRRTGLLALGLLALTACHTTPAAETEETVAAAPEEQTLEEVDDRFYYGTGGDFTAVAMEEVE